MKIIAIFILVLELIALILQIKSECKRHNFTVDTIKDKLKSTVITLKDNSSKLKWRKKR